MEVLKASKPGTGKKLKWSGKTLTSEILRAEIDSAILRAGGVPDEHDRGRRRSGLRSARTRVRPASRRFSLIILDIFPRDAKTGYWGDMTRTVVRGRASEQQRKLWETVKAGQALALKQIKAGRGRDEHSQGNQRAIRTARLSHGSAQWAACRIFSRNRARSWAGNSRISAVAKSRVESGTMSHGRAGSVLSGNRRRAHRRCGDCEKNRCRILSRFPKQLEI